MTAHVSVLALSLALAVSATATAAELPKGGRFAAGTHHWDAERVTGGRFIRTADGVEPARIEIAGTKGLVIDGGEFRTAAPEDLTRGVVLSRGKSISLYNKTPPATPVAGEPAGGGFSLYTESEVRQIFASGDCEAIQRAFTSADAKGVAPEPLTEAAVLAALRGATQLERARTQTAWTFTSEAGDVVVNRGDFAFRSVNQNLMAASAGKLIWNAGTLLSNGGGGDTILQGAQGIDLLGGRIASAGAVDGTILPIQYDSRRRLDRDRWTLGKYLAFVTDGDINIGQLGKTKGPEVRVSDGMLKIDATTPANRSKTTPVAPQHLNLYSGSITLDGQHRSTLLALERGFNVVTVINGGTLNVISAKELIGTPIESPSLWNMQTTLEAGAINLDNAQVIGTDNVIKGGVVTMRGVSAFYSPRGTLAISGGTLNVGPQSFIGAIKGDSRARSPYPTAQQDLAISGGTLNFSVIAPAVGQPLIVGTHIGGIFAGDNDPGKANRPTLSIAPEVKIHIDTKALLPGAYTVANFASVDAGDGTLAIAQPITVGSAAERYTGTLATDGTLSLVVK